MSQRYDAVAVRKYSVNGEEKTQYINIGVAFPFRDKEGFTLKLSAIPAPIDGEYVIMLFPPRERDSGQRSSGGSARPQTSFDAGGGGEIPF